MREFPHLLSRYRAIASYSGFIVLLCSGLMLVPLLSLLAWPEEASQAGAFLAPAAMMGLFGIVVWRLGRANEEVGLSLQEGGLIVVASWVVVCVFSAWPFVVITGLDPTRALFESVSGWTTTGLSVVDVSRASHVILLWRGVMQLAGGAGLAIIMLSAIAGSTGPAVSTAEGRQQLVPHVRQSAKLVIMIYVGYAAIGIFALRLAGMDWFDAVNHAFAAVSTGGFSTRPESIGYWDSASVEAVTIPLMILGSLSFLTAWLLLQGRVRPVIRNGEVRLSAVLIPLCAALLFVFTTRGLYPSLHKGVRVAVFESVSALTTTGFSTVSYEAWNPFGIGLLIVLMFIGGGTCSTAGGFKQFRVHLLWKSLVWDLRRSLLPHTAVVANSVWEADRRVFVAQEDIRRIGTFLFLYLTMFVAGSAILTAYGYGLADSCFECASALGTVGLSVGVVSASAPDGVLWTGIIGMFLGRLEFLVVFSSIAKCIVDAAFILGWKCRR